MEFKAPNRTRKVRERKKLSKKMIFFNVYFIVESIKENKI